MGQSVVTAPDGTQYRVTHPDNATDAEIQAQVAQQHGGGQSADSRPKSFWQGFFDAATPYAANAQRVMDYINPANIAARTVVNAVTPKVHGNPLLPSPDQQVQLRHQQSANAPYQGSQPGRLAGAVVGSAPAMAIPVAGMGTTLASKAASIGQTLLQGTAQGAMGTEDPTDLQQLGTNMAVGAGSNLAGRGAAHVLGSAIGGKTATAAVRLLNDEGVSLTPGQIAGPNSLRQAIEDKVLGSIPGLNSIPDAAAIRGVNSLRGAVANRVMAPIGESMPKGTHIDDAAIGKIQDIVHGAMDKATGNLSLGIDNDLINGLTQIEGNAPRLVGPDGAKQISANVNHIFDRISDQPLGGQPLKDMLGELRSSASGADGEMRSQLWNLHNEVADALERQNPEGAYQDFANAREAQTLLARMNDAASRPGVTNGEFGPTQLLSAAKKTGYGTTKANVANGQARMLDLANAAADVMRNKTANSGTVPRGIAVKALGAGGGPLAMLGTVHPLAAAGIGSSLLGYIPGVAELLQRLALNRPQVLQQFGGAIKGAAPLVGAGTGALGVGLLGQ